MKTLWFRYTYVAFLRVSYKNPRVILMLYSCIWYVFHDILFFILILFFSLYLYKDVYFILILFPFIYIIIYNDYIWDKDYHIYSFIILWSFFFIDISFFLLFFWVGLWDQGSLFVFLLWSFLSMMLLYKDNYPYVVIEIIFSFYVCCFWW